MLDRRFIAAYILLVGFPLLALFGIVDKGRKSRAPISVAGSWIMTANFSSLAGEPCSEPGCEYRARFTHHFTCLVFDDGSDGAGHHFHGKSPARVGLPAEPRWNVPGAPARRGLGCCAGGAPVAAKSKVVR